MLPKILARGSDDTTQACLPWSQGRAAGPLLVMGATDQATPSHFAGFPPQLAAVGCTFTCLVPASLIGRSRVCTSIDFAVRMRRHSIGN